MIAYRPDIDGLRAVAVLLVVAYHAFPEAIGSGFIGVDIFFVISGYLISAIILKDISHHGFSLGRFYVRRIRRLFPALALVIASSYAFGLAMLNAEELKYLAKHVMASSAFVSNFTLWSEASYFDVSAVQKPLLHLWSLSIEEQFYLLWPWVLIAALSRQILLGTVALLAAISLALSIFAATSPAFSSLSFYWPVTRVWEFGAGTFIACIAAGKLNEIRTHEFGRYLSPVGLALVLTGAILIKDSVAYPGAWAILPAIGAALLILGGPSSWVNKTLLSSKVLVWVGLISYPLYLWHWPLLSLARITLGKPVPVPGILALLFLALVLSFLTYQYVEKPTRSGKRAVHIATAWALAMLTLGLVGYLGYANQGYPGRSANNKLLVNQGDTGDDPYREFIRSRFIPCENRSLLNDAPVWQGAKQCHQSRKGKISLALVGDSHADHLFAGLAYSLPEQNVAEYWKGAGASGGFPALERDDYKPIYQAILGNPDIKVVIISAYWLQWGTQVRPDQLVREMKDTARALSKAGKTVYLANDIPVFGFTPSNCKFQKNSFAKNECSMPLDRYINQSIAHRKYLAEIESDGHARILDTAGYFCDKTECFMAKDGSLLYRDEHHLNSSGSIYIASRLLEKELHSLNNTR